MRTLLFPGQGAQFKGMGKDLFPAYPAHTRIATELLGYSIETLCVEDPEHRLGLTQYTQPALYVVNALEYLRRIDAGAQDMQVDYLAGHSLGEYNALLVSEVFDFETGLRLVQKRGELMAAASEGGMAAVIGVNASMLQAILADAGLDGVDLANYNSPKQNVISGKTPDIEHAIWVLNQRGVHTLVLNVSAPFHSRYMRPAQDAFAEFLTGFRFADPTIPVIANVNAQPYERGAVAQTLSRQIASSVLWTDSIRALLEKGDMEFVEIGGSILTRMIKEICKAQPAAS